MDGKRLKFVDGLRGVAAVLVMLYHQVGRTSAGALTHRGYLGVAIFFVLSGFVITGAVGARHINAGFLRRFALRRMIRLDIPYWLNIALALAMIALAARMGVPEQSIQLAQVVAHLVYLQDILGYEEISRVYWTLCLEVQFYLALILLLWCAQLLRIRWQHFMLVFLALLGLSVLANMSWIPAPTGLMFPYWWAFALGAVCYWTLTKRVSARYLAAAALVVALTAPGRHGDWRLTACVTTSLLFLAWRWNAMERWLADRVSQFLGRISYSLYLCHPLIGWSAQSLALRYVDQWSALGIGISMSLVSAWLAYHFIERPSITLSHRVKLETTYTGARGRAESAGMGIAGDGAPPARRTVFSVLQSSIRQFVHEFVPALGRRSRMDAARKARN
ncbi:MAG TPA: acyltransferase [Burkholderiales bacterium]|nr:acyltransferase [Burkholderiales bacterium]